MGTEPFEKPFEESGRHCLVLLLRLQTPLGHTPRRLRRKVGSRADRNQVWAQSSTASATGQCTSVRSWRAEGQGVV